MAQNSNDTMAHEGERIAKVMARAGLASRREAEAWIAAGRVSVNGAVIPSPAVNVTDADHVTVDGKPLPGRERTRLFLFHKPRGLVTTSSDPQGRPTIYGALPKSLPRLITVGRLDLNTEGLLLLTNDGGLARALELPATGWLRRYRVRAHGHVTQPQLEALKQGITIDGIRYGQIDAKLDRSQGANVWVTFAIREGKNREVRNVLGALGLTVSRLIRTSFGPFQLGELPAGQTEEVATRTLRDQLGDKLAKRAGADFSAPIAEPLPPREARAWPKAPARAKSEHGKSDHGKSDHRGAVLARAEEPETPSGRGKDRKPSPTRQPSRTAEPGRPPKRKPQATTPFRGKIRPPRRRDHDEPREARRVPPEKAAREPREAKPASAAERRRQQPFKGGEPWQPRAKPGSRAPAAGKPADGTKAEGKPRGRGRPYRGKRD